MYTECLCVKSYNQFELLSTPVLLLNFTFCWQ